MKDLSDYIASGILELYVMGATTPEETQEVEELAIIYKEVRAEIEEITASLEKYAESHAVQPKATVKPLVLATINYMGRMQQGEEPSHPKPLSETSVVEDYAMWLNRPDMQEPEVLDDIVLKIIAADDKSVTGIVWIKDYADYEVHDKEYERFLIVEGACDILAGENVYHLQPGDYYSVPLHTPHMVKVTSQVPCKVILQRVNIAA